MAGSDFTLDCDSLLVVADDVAEPAFEDMLLDVPATAAAPPVRESLAEAMPWVAALLEEGVVAYIQKKFDESKHPRWPKGTPHAGEFMKIGQRFDAGGKTYEISGFTGGKVVAHLATGKGSETHELVLDKKQAEGVSAASQVEVKGSKSMSKSKAGAVTIDPFVDSKSHDASIAKPESLGVTDAQWKRFGKLDQEHALDLEERFGKWSPGKSKKLISELQKQYDATVQQIISGALSSQYGSSSGNTLSLSGIYSGGVSPKAIEKYEQAKLLLRDTAEAIQWDLYHRCKGPDVAMFHWGGGDPKAKKQQFAGDKQPIMSAYSWSTGALATTGFGSTLTAVPMAIRHVEMHTHSGGVYTSFHGEYEVTTGARIVLDDRAFFTSLSSAPSDVKKYLDKMAPAGGEPASGEILYEANKALADPSYELPLPPEPLGLSAVPTSGNKQYTELPPDVAKNAGETAFSIGYAGGSKEAAKGVLEQLGVKPGDFLEGMKGTRYVVIEDPGDSLSGLRYVKIDPTTKQPVYGKSFSFSASGGNSFYRLDGHVDLPAPEKEKGFEGLTPEAVAAFQPAGAPSKLGTWQAGGKFKADGDIYEYVGPHPSGKVQVKSLTTGKVFLANSGHKATPVEKDANFTPAAPAAAAPTFGEGALVLVTVEGSTGLGTVQAITDGGYEVKYANGTATVPADAVTAPPPMPGEKTYLAGDKFASGGDTYTVTSVLKDGTVRAKVSGGKVEKFSPEVMKASVVYRPSTFAIGNEAQAGSLDIGDVVQGGAGATVRPYVVTGVGEKVWLLNLETGATLSVTKKKTFKRLLDAEQVQAQGDAKKPGEVDGPAKLAPKFVPGDHKPTKDFKPGEYLKMSGDAALYLVVDQTPEGDTTLHKLDADGSFVKEMKFKAGLWNGLTLPSQMAAPATPAQVAAKPELGGSFDKDAWQEGPPTKLKDAPPGTVFLSATGLPMQLKSTAPKGGATAVALHNGKLVKNISYDKDFTTLEPKPAPAPEPPPAPTMETTKGVHVDGLEQHPDFTTYLHPKSGKFKYPKLSQMAAGTIFTDKSGKPFKVHHSNGGQVAISDGTTIWKADPDWRGKVDTDNKVAWLDDAESAAPQADAGDITVGHLAAGDVFTIPPGYAGAGEKFEVIDPTPIPHGGIEGSTDPADAPYTTMKVKPVGGGKQTEIATSLVPGHVRKADVKVKPPKNFAVTGGEVSAADIPKFGFAMTSAGTVVFRTNENSFKEIGHPDEVDVGEKVTPVQWSGGPIVEDTAGLVADGKPTMVTAARAGDMFMFNQAAFLVLGSSPKGFTGMKLGPGGYVAFQPYASSHVVQPVKFGDGDAPVPAAPDPTPAAAPAIAEITTIPSGFVKNAKTFADLPIGTMYVIPFEHGGGVIAELGHRMSKSEFQVESPYGQGVAEATAVPDFVWKP